MQGISSKIYDKNYYLHVCLGSEEFRKSRGKILHPRLQHLLKNLSIDETTKILDIGCGRGDILLFLGRKAKFSIGIDYSKAAIHLANQTKKRFPKNVQKKVMFHRMNMKRLNFPNDYFDLVLCIDVLEHVYTDEVEKTMKEISRVLKPNGVFFIHTGPNKVLNDFTYPRYILPMNRFLTKIDQIITRKKYAPLPNNPRTNEELKQHVHEPTFFYLQNLYRKFSFSGGIQMEIGYIKPVTTIKTIAYNALVALYPLSKIFPLTILFGWNFVSQLRNEKKVH